MAEMNTEETREALHAMSRRITLIGWTLGALIACIVGASALMVGRSATQPIQSIIRAEGLEIVGPGSLQPAVSVSAGPDGEGAIVVRGKHSAGPCIVIGVNQHSVGGIDIFAPNQNGGETASMSLSATGGITQSRLSTIAWHLSSTDAGGALTIADERGTVFAVLRRSPSGKTELVLSDPDGKSKRLVPE